jgi:hypothetical protein
MRVSVETRMEWFSNRHHRLPNNERHCLRRDALPVAGFLVIGMRQGGIADISSGEDFSRWHHPVSRKVGFQRD